MLSVCSGPMQRSSLPFLWGSSSPMSWWERLSRMTLNLCLNFTVRALTHSFCLYPTQDMTRYTFTYPKCLIYPKAGRLYDDPMIFKCNRQNFPDLPEWLRLTQRHPFDNGFLYGTPTSPGKSIIEVWRHDLYQQWHVPQHAACCICSCIYIYTSVPVGYEARNFETNLKNMQLSDTSVVNVRFGCQILGDKSFGFLSRAAILNQH